MTPVSPDTLVIGSRNGDNDEATGHRKDSRVGGDPRADIDSAALAEPVDLFLDLEVDVRDHSADSIQGPNGVQDVE